MQQVHYAESRGARRMNTTGKASGSRLQREKESTHLSDKPDPVMVRGPTLPNYDVLSDRVNSLSSQSRPPSRASYPELDNPYLEHEHTDVSAECFQSFEDFEKKGRSFCRGAK